MKDKKLKRYETLAAGHIGDATTQRFTERTIRCFGDAETLRSISLKWRNVHSDKAQGHIFEQLETMKFNMDALKKDSDIFAETTASAGYPTDPVDIEIKRGSDILREVQAKSCHKPSMSMFSLSQEKYDEMARLAPKEQHDEIKRLLDSRIETGTLKAEDYEQTRRNLLDTLRHENVASEGTSYAESLEATDPKTAQNIANKTKVNSAITDVHESGKAGGAAGGVLAGSATAFNGAYQAYKGEAEVGNVITDVAVSAGKGYASGYAITATSKGVVHTTTHFLGESASKGLVRSNAHVAIAAGITTSAKSVVSYIKGDIDSEEMLSNVSHTAITCSSSFYYGAVGQAMIPVPVVGALVGSTVGYFVGNMIHQAGLVGLGDPECVTAARSRRKVVEAMCLEAVQRKQYERREMEEVINQYFEERESHFQGLLDGVDEAIESSDAEKFVRDLNNINALFGSTLQFSNFQEFDAFMESGESFKL